MALFLSRAAKAMGVDLMGGDMAADYSDIGDQGEERQAAIKALARNGILNGRSSMSFMPDAEITRAEMAVALMALLDKTSGAPVHKNKAGLYVLGADADTAVAPDDSFSDAYAAVSQPVYNAISRGLRAGRHYRLPRRDLPAQRRGASQEHGFVHQACHGSQQPPPGGIDRPGRQRHDHCLGA